MGTLLWVGLQIHQQSETMIKRIVKVMMKVIMYGETNGESDGV